MSFLRFDLFGDLLLLPLLSVSFAVAFPFSLLTTIYQVNNCVVISVWVFAHRELSACTSMFFYVFSSFTLPVCSLQSCHLMSVRAGRVHTQSHWFCLFITHFVINSIWIRCRVQPMITDQTVAINMKVRKRFFTFIFVRQQWCRLCLHLPLFPFILWFPSNVDHWKQKESMKSLPQRTDDKREDQITTTKITIIEEKVVEKGTVEEPVKGTWR